MSQTRSNAYIIEIHDRAAGIVTRDARGFRFFSSERLFDSLEGERVKIASGGMHHFIDLDVVQNVKDGVVRLTQTKDEAMRTWH